LLRRRKLFPSLVPFQQPPLTLRRLAIVTLSLSSFDKLRMTLLRSGRALSKGDNVRGTTASPHVNLCG